MTEQPVQRTQRGGEPPAAAFVQVFQRVFVGGAAVLQLGQLVVQPGILGKSGLQLPAESVLLRFGPQLDGAQGLQQGLAGLFVLEAAQRIVMI